MMVLTNVGKELVIAMDAWVLMTLCVCIHGHVWSIVVTHQLLPMYLWFPMSCALGVYAYDDSIC